MSVKIIGELPWRVGFDNDRYIRDANKNLVLVLTEGLEKRGPAIVSAINKHMAEEGWALAKAAQPDVSLREALAVHGDTEKVDLERFINDWAAWTHIKNSSEVVESLNNFVARRVLEKVKSKKSE